MVKRGKSIKTKTTLDKKNKKANNTKVITSDKQLAFLTFIEKHSLFFLGLFLSLMLIFIFRNYIFFNNLFLFKDIGSDTINTFYPSYVLMSEIAKENLVYTFRNGMGSPVGGGIHAYCYECIHFIQNPFNYTLKLYNGQDIAYALGIAEALKIFTAGIIFFYYLRTIGLTKYVTITGALIFSFSGLMIGGSGWYQQTIQLIYVALLLFSFEQALMKKRVVIFLIITTITFRALNPFYIYVFGLFLIVYSIMRVVQEKNNIKDIFIFYFKIGIATIIALLINFPYLQSRIQSILLDPRVSGNLNKADDMQKIAIFATGDFLHNVTALLRFFSNDILGTGQISEKIISGQRYLISDFKGYYNYYEAPMFYIGIISLLFFPQVFALGKRKEKILYGLFFVIWLIPIVFPYFRRAYFLFFGDYYRAFSLFLPFAILYPALQSFNSFYKEFKINIYLLWSTALILLILLYFPYFSSERLLELNLQENPISINIRTVLTLIIIAESLLITVIINNIKLRIPLFYLLGFIIIAELIYTANITLNDRNTVSVKEFKTKTGYNDYTIEALNYINSIDSTFFRVEKDYSSGLAIHGSLNDAKVQGYNGTTSYASHQNPHYVKFLQEVELIPKGDETAARWSNGVRSRALLAVIANVKYMLSKSETPYFLKFGYELIHKEGDVSIYRNKYNLPLGTTYSKMIKLSEFETFSVLEKDICMLKAIVLQDSIIDTISNFEIYKPSERKGYSREELSTDATKLENSSLQNVEFKEDNIKGNLSLKEDKILFFSILYDKNWKLKINGKPKETFISNIAFTGVYLEKGNYNIELKYEKPIAPTGSSLSNIILILLLITGITYEIWFTKKQKSAFKN